MGKYKVGDYVIVRSAEQCKEGNGIYTNNLLTKLYSLKEENKFNPTGMYLSNSNFIVKDKNNRYRRIKSSHIIRKASKCEIDEKTLSFINELYESNDESNFKIVEQIFESLNQKHENMVKNCRWATRTEQNRNKRNNAIILDLETGIYYSSKTEVVETFGITISALEHKLKKNKKIKFTRI